MRKVILLFVFSWCLLAVTAQQPATPDQIYGELFVDVQTSRIFPDGKTFVDCVPKRDPAAIVADYLKIKSNPAIRFSLKMFVEENFIIPAQVASGYQTNKNEDAAAHITNLWKVLQRKADAGIAGSSLLPLQDSYIVPGGRFREIYYWDSYFTMLGLQQSKEYDIIENMVNNFAFLIQKYGHIPNGNRSYYLSRSQPPYFSLMVGLLAEIKGDQVYAKYLPSLQKEYNYWMDGAETLRPGQANRRVVKMKDGALLNRYWDDKAIPRQESYLQDVETADKSSQSKPVIYRHLRAGAESGWDFSSRWFRDAKNLTTIQTTDIIPVDLNSLLYNLEITIAKASSFNGEQNTAKQFNDKAGRRKIAVMKYTWNNSLGFFTDYNFTRNTADTMITAAGAYPLFVNMASSAQAAKVEAVIKNKLLKPGGIVTTNNRTGQQWDSPNGWAPLQWVTIKGLENYGKKTLARTIAVRWLALNDRVFKATGKMMEKYNVVDTNLEAGGGEYPSQDGFGWTNGVYLKLSSMYAAPSP